MSNSRLRGLHRLSIDERLRLLEHQGFLTAADADTLRCGRHLVAVSAADRMVENVIATFALPLAVAPNFVVDGRDHVVPMVIEEPSVVAALGAAARLARRSGGFETSQPEQRLTGQVHLAGVDDIEAAEQRIAEHADRLVADADALNPRLKARGGGVRSLETRRVELDDGRTVLAVHFQVATGDAMGANTVNTICEAMAPALSALSGGAAALRILTNLADASVISASVRIALADLGRRDADAIAARDGIVLANDIARADPYRAATHNKGIMNGIDPLAIATGNDWRAIEAGAHAYAARGGRYTALTNWRVAEDGGLAGDIAVPLKPATVGGTLAANPAAAFALRLAGVTSAAELASLMAAVGLAQNFSALRALATTGIQAGHMRLHARSVAAAAGLGEEGLAELVASGDVSATKARELADRKTTGVDPGATAAGKVILFGEHAVVYGRHALALPITDAVSAIAEPCDDARITIPDWRVSLALGDANGGPVVELVRCAARLLGVAHDACSLRVRARVPAAMGLGASAALAVAVTRALARAHGVPVDDERVNAIAFECEKLAHGTPSGVDNTLATVAQPLLYRRQGEVQAEPVVLRRLPPLVIACGHGAGRTSEQVAGVRERRARQEARFDRLFDEIDALALEGLDALREGNDDRLGELMNVNQGLLNGIGVSTPELEHLVHLARSAGALGAKLTGAGGGGSIIALAQDDTAPLEAAFAAAGYRTVPLAGPQTQEQATSP